MKIANRDARQYVQQQRPFQGNSIFAERKSDMYVVYSYGTHWPLFVHCNGAWFENEERHSVTTSKHRSQTHPHCSTVLLSAAWMKRLVNGGYQAIAKERILGPSPQSAKQQRDPVWLSAHGM